MPVGELDVPDPMVELSEDRTSFGLNNRELDILAGELSDGVDRFPACNDDDLGSTLVLDPLERRSEKPAGALKARPDGTFEVRDVRVRLL